MTRHRRPRHRTARHSRPVRLSRLLTVTVAASTVVVVASGIVASGEVYALWTSQSPVAPVTLSSGSLSIEIESELDGEAWTNMLPGESARQPFTVRNTGDAPVALTAEASAADGVEVRLAPIEDCVADLTGAPATASSVTLGTLLSGASAEVCVEARLLSTAQPGAALTAEVLLSGELVVAGGQP